MARYDVAVGKDEPYATGTPAVTTMANVRTPQELQTAANWLLQQAANLLAGGMVAGGAKSP